MREGHRPSLKSFPPLLTKGVVGLKWCGSSNRISPLLYGKYEGASALSKNDFPPPCQGEGDKGDRVNKQYRLYGLALDIVYLQCVVNL